jgi:growth hormone secretagogue receptor
MNITGPFSSVAVEKNGHEEISRYIYAIVFPVIFIFGLIGNLLSSIVFSITKLNHTSCGIYFLLLAIFDSLALIGGLHHCLTIGYHVPVPNAMYCRARNFFLYMAMDMTSWMVVAISVDRYLKVKYPIKARMYGTRKLSIIVSCILITIFIIKNFHLITVFIGDFRDDAVDNCDPNPEYPSYVSFFKNIWPWIDLITYALLPFIIVAFCNAFIIYDQYKRRLKLRNRNLDLSLISLLLVSSFSLILCNLPITILAVIYPYISVSYDTKDVYDDAAFAFDILRLPSYGSLAFNFYLYYYTSTLFRQQTVLLYRRICRKEIRTNDMELPPRIPKNDDEPEEEFGDSDGQQRSSVPPITDDFIQNYYRE